MAARVLILEPGLVDARGHHAIAAERFGTLIGPHRTIIAGGASWAGPPSLGGSAVLPIFRRHRLDVARLRRYGRVVGRVFSIADRFAGPVVTLMRRQLNSMSNASIEFPVARADAKNTESLMACDLLGCLRILRAEAHDRVFIPSADAELILAAAALLNAGGQTPFMHLRLIYDDVGCHSTEPTWRSALGVLLDARHSRERVSLLVETSAFAAAAREVWERQIAILPHPSPIVAAPTNPVANGFTLYVPGENRADKGAHLLASVVRALSRKLVGTDKPLRILAHDVASAGCAMVEVERLPAFLSQVGYANNWRRAHAALLLHDPRMYRLRGSGVASDAVALAVPTSVSMGVL